MAVQQDSILKARARVLGHALAAGRAEFASLHDALGRLPSMVEHVHAALRHAGLDDVVALLPSLDVESTVRGAKAYPESSAQHHALWAAVLATMARQRPLEAGRYAELAETSARLALEAPIAEPTRTGVQASQPEGTGM